MRTLVAALFFALPLSAFAADDRVDLPDNFPEEFVEYLSLDRVQNHDQFIRLYADETAMQGVDENGELPEGALLVAEVFSVLKDDEGNVRTTALNRRIADKKLLIAVMEKKAEYGANPASPIRTGDWDFGAFKPDGTRAPKNLNECRACHTPLTDSDFVFSIEHLPIASADKVDPD